MTRSAWLLGVALLTIGPGCGGSHHRHVHMRVKGQIHVSVAVDPEVNQKSPIPVDIVLVYNEELVDKLAELTAQEWFARRQQFARDQVRGEDFDSWSWEWVPGQRVEEMHLPGKSKAKAGFVFARYIQVQAHRQRFEPKKNLRILLGADDFVVQPIG